MDWLEAALGVAQGVCRRHMRCIVINIKGIKLTINKRFPSKAVDDQVSLNRKLTFRHEKRSFLL